ncbi:MAG: hypothetical protein NT166_19125 [Candidatus Aminicenantes bacterium]|nr:hypothetical protein [Candidatus Aminicenantes bacterium]
MKKKRVTILLWALAFILTLALAVYQRLTGPTHPLAGSESVKGKVISYRLLRSFTEFQSLPVKIQAPAEVTAWLSYKRYKTSDEWTEVAMKRQGEYLAGEIPGQPAAGKVEYTIRLQWGEEDILLNRGRSIVARFKGETPTWLLITHVVFMFLGILFAVRAGLETLRKDGNYARLAIWTLGFVFIGGLVLGPFVQKYAFGSWWTGVPFGTDLTDNKTLIAFIAWAAALFLKKMSKWWILAAAVLMIAVYLIPHSIMGSELDYQSGKMKNKFEQRGT